MFDAGTQARAKYFIGDLCSHQKLIEKLLHNHLLEGIIL